MLLSIFLHFNIVILQYIIIKSIHLISKNTYYEIIRN